MNEDYDFTKYYKKGDIVYYSRCMNSVGVSEVKKLKLRTIESASMVGNTEKGAVVMIGRDMVNLLFKTLFEAKEHLTSISKVKPVAREFTVKYDEKEENIDDKDNIESYIDAKSEE